MHIKRDVFERHVEYLQLKTGLNRKQIYETHNISYAVITKATAGGNMSPTTVYRIAKMFGCDPLELIIEDDIPKPVRKKKASAL